MGRDAPIRQRPKSGASAVMAPILRQFASAFPGAWCGALMPYGDTSLTSQRSGLEIVGLALVVVVGVLPFLLTVAADPDLWWQVRTGQLILADGLPAVDDWSFTATGNLWTNHEWLSSIAIAAAYDARGAAGLLMLRGLLFVTLVAGLVVAYAHRVREPLLVLVCLMFTVPVIGLFINVRAHSFTYALAVWAVVVLDRVRAGRLRWLAAMPLMVVLWANLHGGFAFGLAVFGSGLLFMLLGLDGMPARPVGRARSLMVAGGIATLAAALVNPYGLELFGFVLEVINAENPTISEWQPIQGRQVAYFWAYLLIPVALWLWARRWRHVGLLFLLLLTAASTWRSARFFVLMAVFGSLVAAEALGALRSRLGDRPSVLGRILDPKAAVASLVALTVLFGGSFLAGWRRGEATVDVDTAIYPIAATAWLAEEGAGPNLAIPLRWGGYAIWHLGPEVKVAVDGRNVTVYEKEWVDAYLVALEEGRVLDVLDENRVDVWMLQTDSLQVASLENTGRWSIAYRDPVAVVLLRDWAGRPVEGPAATSPVEFP